MKPNDFNSPKVFLYLTTNTDSHMRASCKPDLLSSDLGVAEADRWLYWNILGHDGMLYSHMHKNISIVRTLRSILFVSKYN